VGRVVWVVVVKAKRKVGKGGGNIMYEERGAGASFTDITITTSLEISVGMTQLQAQWRES